MKSLREQYQAQVRRIRLNAVKMAKRGYNVPENIVPPEPKKITSGTIRRLKAITPKKIASVSTYHGRESYGEEISGTEAFKLEKKTSARKSAETRRAKSVQAKREKQDKSFAQSLKDAMKRGRTQSDFERERRKKDAEERKRMEREQYRREQFSEGRLLLDGIQRVINGASTGEQFAADTMQNILDTAIDQLGEERVVLNLADASEDVIGEAQMVLKYNPATNPDGFRNHADAFARIVTGSPMSAEFASDLDDAIERASYVNDEENYNYRSSDVGTAGTADFV